MTTNHTLTLAEYKQLEADGKITRPLTDGAIGSATAGKRHLDAQLSAMHPAGGTDDLRDRQPANRGHRQRSTRDDVRAIHEGTTR